VSHLATIAGCAARFDCATDDNRRHALLFRPGCFDGVLKRRGVVPMKINHEGRALATTATGLDVWADSCGLHWRLDVDDTPANRDLVNRISDGALAGSSCSILGKAEFPVVRGTRHQRFLEITELLDVGPVDRPGNSWARTQVYRAWDPLPIHLQRRESQLAAVIDVEFERRRHELQKAEHARLVAKRGKTRRGRSTGRGKPQLRVVGQRFPASLLANMRRHVVPLAKMKAECDRVARNMGMTAGEMAMVGPIIGLPQAYLD